MDADVPEAHALAERDAELSAIDAALAAAREGRGTAVVLEGISGIGKSALVQAATARAVAAGLTVRAGYGGDLEAAAPWSVARQLYGAEAVAAGTADAGPGGLFAALHDLFWRTERLAEAAPVLLTVDDAHLVDAPSSLLLGFLARRLAGLPAVLVVAGRPVPEGGAGTLSQVAAAAGVGILEPRPLRVRGVAAMLRAAGVDPALAAECHAATGGTPLLVREVAVALAAPGPPGQAAPRIEEVAARGVARAALSQVAAAGPDAIAFVAALAVLDQAPGADLPTRLAGLPAGSGALCADALCAAGLLLEGPPLRFSHPLVREAVLSELPAARAATLHRAAAVLLAERDEAGPAASHLLAAGPGGDPAAVATLRTAAARALAAGDAATAGTLLERALAEPPPAEARGGVLAELGAALARTGRPEAAERLLQALAAEGDPAARARIAATLAPLLVALGRAPEAVDVLEGALVEMDASGAAAGELEVRLEVELMAATRRDLRLRARVAERLERLRALVGTGEDEDPVADAGQRVVLAALAFDAVAHAPAAQASALGRRALGDGQLVREHGAESPALSMAVIALWMAEELDVARATLDAALEQARADGSVLGFVMLSCWRAHVAWRAGDLALAEADASGALEVARDLGLPPAVTYATAALGDALLDRGGVDAAAALLDDPLVLPAPVGGDHDQPLLLFRGRLRAAQGRHDEALADLLACGAGLAAFGCTTPVVPWRAEAALAAAAGDPDRAEALAGEAVARARAFGVPGALGTALRAQGLVEASIPLLRAAVDALAGSPCRLDHAKALADLGAAERAAGDGTAALRTLRQGLDLAGACGADALAERIRGDMVALGARPRRPRTSGPAALTASELRVAGLAAEGRTNREIAQTLFVTVRTVEMHLSHAYRKLEIAGRGDLAAALAREDG